MLGRTGAARAAPAKALPSREGKRHPAPPREFRNARAASAPARARRRRSTTASRWRRTHAWQLLGYIRPLAAIPGRPSDRPRLQRGFRYSTTRALSGRRLHVLSPGSVVREVGEHRPHVRRRRGNGTLDPHGPASHGASDSWRWRSTWRDRMSAPSRHKCSPAVPRRAQAAARARTSDDLAARSRVGCALRVTRGPPPTPRCRSRGRRGPREPRWRSRSPRRSMVMAASAPVASPTGCDGETVIGACQSSPAGSSAALTPSPVNP